MLFDKIKRGVASLFLGENLSFNPGGRGHGIFWGKNSLYSLRRKKGEKPSLFLKFFMIRERSWFGLCLSKGVFPFFPNPGGD